MTWDAYLPALDMPMPFLRGSAYARENGREGVFMGGYVSTAGPVTNEDILQFDVDTNTWTVIDSVPGGCPNTFMYELHFMERD